MLNEQLIIERFQQDFQNLPPHTVGIGDDAAIIPIDQNECYAITKDLLVEDIHFRLNYFDAHSIAHKTLHANMSDIAAMGATPQYAILGLALPSDLSSDWVKAFIDSFAQLCHTYKIFLVGGDTTSSKHHLILSLTLIGKAFYNNIRYRHTAKANDIICIVGQTGEAHIGLAALERNLPKLEQMKTRALRPIAKVLEGQWLGSKTSITAMIDVSDGLYVDLEKLCAASKVGAQIHLDRLYNPDFLQACASAHLDPDQCLLIGGEDYNLLCTIDALEYAKIAQDFQGTFHYNLINIGSITPNKEIEIFKNNKKFDFIYQPFSHFGEL